MTTSKMWSLLVLETLLLSLSVFGTPLERGNAELFNEIGRIVNGRAADIGELPYQASIQYRSSDFHFCGGTFITRTCDKDNNNNNGTSGRDTDDIWVLTAAHCMRNQNEENLRVVLGATNLDDKKNPVFRVTKIISHKYNDQNKIGDLALMKLVPDELHEDARTTHPMATMDLNPEGFDPTGLFCKVSGWGHLTSGSQGAPRDLQVVDVEMVSPNMCAKMLGDGLPWDADAMVCAGGRSTDACQGDSGGPLVCTSRGNGNNRQNEHTYLSGIVSWGVGCATEGIPGVYTNVKNYISWIKKTMCEN